MIHVIVAVTGLMLELPFVFSYFSEPGLKQAPGQKLSVKVTTKKRLVITQNNWYGSKNVHIFSDPLLILQEHA
jgi:hypothetical protein